MSVFIKQAIVNTSGVDTHSRYLVALKNAFSDRIFYLMENAKNIPAKASVLNYRLIEKAMILLYLQLFSVKASYYSSTA